MIMQLPQAGLLPSRVKKPQALHGCFAFGVVLA